jgi:prepilin-type N-terminal cleavage/methylation domain-containing protein
MKRKQKTDGFTLIELLVVISVIGLLASIILAATASARIKAKDVARLATIHQIITAMNLYYDTQGNYPPSGANDPSGVGLDLSGSGSFLQQLSDSGYVPTNWYQDADRPLPYMWISAYLPGPNGTLIPNNNFLNQTYRQQCQDYTLGFSTTPASGVLFFYLKQGPTSSYPTTSFAANAVCFY